MGIIQAGMSQVRSPKTLAPLSELCRSGGINFRPTGPWLMGRRFGRPASFSVVAKLVMKKAVGKKGQWVTKLAQQLGRKGNPVYDRSIRHF